MKFKSNNCSTLLVKIWWDCPANCERCTIERNSKVIKYESFLNTLNKINEKFEKNFSIFLFWINFVDNPDIEKYINFFQKNNFNSIALHIKPVISKKMIEWIKEISKKYKNINFDFVLHVDKKEDIKDLVVFLKYFKEQNIYISADIFVSNYFKELLYLIGQIWYKIIKWISSHNLYSWCVEAKNNNISIILYKKLGNANIFWYSCPYDKCFISDLFWIKNSDIYINEEIEIEYNWTIDFHFNVYCSKYMKNITNILYSDKKIKSDINNVLEKIKKSKCQEI